MSRTSQPETQGESPAGQDSNHPEYKYYEKEQLSNMISSKSFEYIEEILLVEAARAKRVWWLGDESKFQVEICAARWQTLGHRDNIVIITKYIGECFLIHHHPGIRLGIQPIEIPLQI